MAPKSIAKGTDLRKGGNNAPKAKNREGISDPKVKK